MNDLFTIKSQLDRIEKKMERKINPTWIDLKSAEKYCSLSASTLRRAMRCGKLKFRRSKRKLLFKHSWLDQFINR